MGTSRDTIQRRKACRRSSSKRSNLQQPRPFLPRRTATCVHSRQPGCATGHSGCLDCFLSVVCGHRPLCGQAGFPDLVVGECSISPIGLCMAGFSLVLIWLQSTRLLRVRDLLKDNVPMEDVAAMLTLHDPSVGGGTGYEESESEIED